MERPKIENYTYPETNHLHTQKYVDDLNAYIDQLEAEKKELIEKFIEAMKVYEYTGFDDELFILLRNVKKELSDEN